MKTKYWIVAVFSAAVLVAGLAWALDTGLVGGSAVTAGTPTNTMSPTPSADTTASGQATRSNSKGSTATDELKKAKKKTSKPGQGKQPGSADSAKSSRRADAAATATRPSWDPQPAASETAGLEMPTEAPDARTTLPKSKERKGVLPSTPATGASKGKLTSGFPKKAVPYPSGTSITASSVSTQGKRVLVSLEGRTKASPSKIIAFYADDFAAKGWASTPRTPQAGESVLEGGFKNDSMVVTTTKLPTGQTAFVVAGAFTVGG